MIVISAQSFFCECRGAPFGRKRGAAGFLRLMGLKPEGCGLLTQAGCVEGLRKKVQRVQRIMWKSIVEEVLKFDGSTAVGFLGLTAAYGAEDCGLPFGQ